MCKLNNGDKFYHSKSMRLVDEKQQIGALLKAKDLSVNFSNVTTSSDVTLQMYASPQCLTSGGLIQYSRHYIACFSTRILDGQQNYGVYNQ